jgi:hypothetical protein
VIDIFTAIDGAIYTVLRFHGIFPTALLPNGSTLIRGMRSKTTNHLIMRATVSPEESW